MDIVAHIFAAGVPQNGLAQAPQVQIRRTDTGAIVQAFVAMTDQGADGLYTFAFSPAVVLAYAFIVDADPTVTGQVPAGDRYYTGSFTGEIDVSELDAAYMTGVWVDTVGGGAAGSVVGVNGLQTNPVDNITDALLLANALGIRSFKLRGPITLNAAFPRAIWEAVAGGGTLDPAGFDVGGGIFIRVGLTGNVNVATGDIFGFQTSLLGPVSGLTGVLVDPGLTGTITAGAGVLTIASGASIVPGVSTPIIDLNGVASLNLRNYSGGLDLRGSTAPGQNSSVEIVAGQVILDASNTAGIIAVRGWPDLFNNSAGATVNLDGYGPILVDEEQTTQHGAGAWTTGTPATQQSIRDAMKLTPTGGAPAAGSVDLALDNIEADTAAMEPLVSLNLDATVSSRATSVEVGAVTTAVLAAIALLNDLSIADVQTAMTSQGYTAGRAVLLDNLDAAITTRATQAQILSDATPFPGANIDALISSRAVAGDLMGLTAGTLTAIQALILSDATPFQGADIAAILTSALNLRDFIEGGRDIDFTGNDVLGWQRIERDTSGTLIRRYNLFDETGSRINETVASFIGRQGMISSEVAI